MAHSFNPLPELPADANLRHAVESGNVAEVQRLQRQADLFGVRSEEDISADAATKAAHANAAKHILHHFD